MTTEASPERPIRSAATSRTTKETSIEASLVIDGSGQTDVSTGVPFYDHMLDQIGRHASFDLVVKTTGDVHVDAHHTVEDTAIVLGELFAQAIGNKAGVRRFASGLYPLDEALVEVAVDLSGRPYFVWNVELPESIPLGTPPFDPSLAEHVFQSFATAAGITLHITMRDGRNVHHIIEAAFKGVARCLRDAVRIEGTDVPSTKGSL
ncbi:MAG: imidazoleglycerol-phosphate dehydratase HisB [Acidimicrobiales bacterium]